MTICLFGSLWLLSCESYFRCDFYKLISYADEFVMGGCRSEIMREFRHASHLFFESIYFAVLTVDGAWVDATHDFWHKLCASDTLRSRSATVSEKTMTRRVESNCRRRMTSHRVVPAGWVGGFYFNLNTVEDDSVKFPYLDDAWSAIITKIAQLPTAIGIIECVFFCEFVPPSLDAALKTAQQLLGWKIVVLANTCLGAKEFDAFRCHDRASFVCQGLESAMEICVTNYCNKRRCRMHNEAG